MERYLRRGETKLRKALSLIIIGLLCFSTLSILAPQVEANTETIIFQDDFETYTVGSFPSPGGWELIWNGKGTQYQIVTDTVSHSLTKSLQLWGRPSWSANVQREFTSGSEMLGYEVYVRTVSNTGMYHNIASVCFWNLSGLAWGKRFADTWFGQDGEIYTRPVSESPFVPLGLTYEAHRWYKVRVVVDRTAETYNVWIDDILVAQDIGIWDTNEIEALMLQSGHAGVKGYFDDVKIFEGIPSTTTLKVTVFDESGFPPASSSGPRSLADIPVKVSTLDDTLVVSGVTDPSGIVSFNIGEGTYKIVYGGLAIDPRGGSAYGSASKIVDVSGSFMSIDLYCSTVTFHSYEAGGPYELNYVDLDRDSAGYQDAMTVQPGEQINAEFSWWELETHNVPVWYVSVFGSWSETSALGNLKSGCASPSAYRLHTASLSFTAPTTPGTYEVRLLGVLDYTWPNSYYTGAHYNPSLGRDMGIGIIGKGVHEPYGTGTIVVRGNLASKPRGLRARPEFSEIRLGWFEPQDLGDPPIQSYNIYRWTQETPKTMIAQVDYTSMYTRYNDTICDDNLYYYEVTAVNSAGESPPSDTKKSSRKESIKGIGTVVTINDFRVDSDWWDDVRTHTKNIVFTIQQNFIIPIQYNPYKTLLVDYYWVQNTVTIISSASTPSPTNSKMRAFFQVWRHSWTGGPEWNIEEIDKDSQGWANFKNTIVMRSAISGSSLILENDFGTREVPIVLDTDSYIYLESFETDTELGAPEIVIVSSGTLGTYSVDVVPFRSQTSGHVDTYVLVGEETWLNGEYTTNSPIQYDKSFTAEKSIGLEWNTNSGDFSYNPLLFDFPPIAYPHQGFWFVPDYEQALTEPPDVPYPPASKKSMKVHLGSPANLCIFDPIGSRLGYDIFSGIIGCEIPDTIYRFFEDYQEAIIFEPIDGNYIVLLIGIATGTYTITGELLTSEGIVTQTNSGEIVEGETLELLFIVSGNEMTSTPPLPAVSIEKLFKPEEISTKRRGAVLSRSNITNSGYLDITEVHYEDEILDGWTLKDFDHTISATLFIDGEKYKIPYDELDRVSIEGNKYVVYFNLTAGVNLYQFNATSGMEEYRMTIYASEPGWVLEIKYPMIPPKGIQAGDYDATVSVAVTSPQSVSITAEQTATLRVK